MRRRFVLPIDRQNPPTPSVVEQLNAVDSAHERVWIVRVMTRFVRAPDVSDTAKLFGAARNFLFVESMLRKKRFRARNETIYMQDLRHERVIPARLCGRD